MAFTAESPPAHGRHTARKPQGSSKWVLPWQVTMDQLICSSLSHAHYWYEVVCSGHIESIANVPTKDARDRVSGMLECSILGIAVQSESPVWPSVVIRSGKLSGTHTRRPPGAICPILYHAIGQVCTRYG